MRAVCLPESPGSWQNTLMAAKKIEKPQSSSKHSSRLAGFYERSLPDRVAQVAQWSGLDADAEATLLGMTGLNSTQADHMIENVIGIYALPLGLATNFLINGK